MSSITKRLDLLSSKRKKEETLLFVITLTTFTWTHQFTKIYLLKELAQNYGVTYW